MVQTRSAESAIGGHESSGTKSGARELLALAERCEQASASDRELDGEIWKALVEKPGDVWTDHFGHWMRQDPNDRVAFDDSPLYTFSFDDALTLAPENCTVYLTRPNQDLPYKANRCSYACVAPPGLGGPQFARKRAHLSSHAVTPALALTAAALKARASKLGTDPSVCGVSSLSTSSLNKSDSP